MNSQCMSCKFYKKKERAYFVNGTNFACGGFCAAGYCKKKIRKNKTLKAKTWRQVKIMSRRKEENDYER